MEACNKCGKTLQTSTWRPRRANVPPRCVVWKNARIKSCRFGCGCAYLFDAGDVYLDHYWALNLDALYARFNRQPEMATYTPDQIYEHWKEQEYARFIPAARFLSEFKRAQALWKPATNNATRRTVYANPNQNQLFE